MTGVEKMDDERAAVQAKKFVVEGSEKGRFKKRWKEVVKKDMLVRGLRRTKAQDCSLQRLGHRNQLILT